MKHIKARYILYAMLLASPFTMNAQTAENDTLSSEPLVNIAYRQVAQDDIIGSVAVVNYEELTEKNYNTYSLDNMQAYVSGFNGNSLWGMDGDNDQGYLVLIDGVPRAANNVLPTEIAQITFLKSAQAVVLYGSRAAKGAVLITTKRSTNDGLNVSVRANTGVHVAKAFPEYLSSAEYMTYYNEALANDGLSPLYSAEEIYNHASGLNPYRYPDVNYYSSEYIRKAYNRTDVTAEITGGGKRAHFYSNVSYYNQGDFLKVGEAANNNTSRFNVRGNVDVQINDFIKAYINANTTFYDTKSGKGDYWSAAATMRPNYPQHAAPLIPVDMIDPNALGAFELIGAANLIDGKYFLGGTQQTTTNVFGDMYSAGRSKWTSRQFQFDTGAEVDLKSVLKGLKFKTNFAMDYATSYTTSYDNSYAVYVPTWSNYNGQDVIIGLSKEGNDEKSGNQNISGSTANMTILFNAMFDYNRTFAQKHNVTAMLVAAGFQQTVSGSYHRISNANLGVQATYNYDRRYYVDFSGAYVHSAKFAPGHRGAFSPSVTLGWKIANESFLKDSRNVNDLTFSVSGSILNQDIDIADYYLWTQVWKTDNYGYEWNDGNLSQYVSSTRGANDGLTFIKRKEVSANLRGAFFDNSLTFDASYFIQSMEGYTITNTTTWPSHLAVNVNGVAHSFLPTMNFNNNARTGFDMSLNYNKTFGDFTFAVGANATWYDTIASKRDEVYNDYRQREGKPLDGIWGYQSAGLFQSQEEIDNWYTQKLGSTVRPGDIKYVDQNGDGEITTEDQVFLGKGGWYGNPLTLGLNLTLKYKSFTLFALATAGYGAYGVKNSSYYWIDDQDKYSAVVRDRWTQETAATATYPRLTVSEGANNFVTSDFWMYKTDRIDLAKVQLTYEMPQSVLNNNKVVKGFSAYISGSNLLTISPERKHMEMNVGSAPQTRFYNLGVKLVF